jgi:hypothetical protein
MLCDACARQPIAIEGHKQLVPHFEATASEPAGPAILFVCMKCGAKWSRVYTGDGAFVWARYSHPGSDTATRETSGRGVG